MSTVAVNGLVEAPAADLWRVLTEHPRRTPGGGPVEMLTTGAFGPGTSWREIRVRPDGGTVVEEFVVLVAEPPRRLVLGSPGDRVDYRITWTLRDVRRRRRRYTEVRVTVQAQPAATSGRAVALLLGGLAVRAAEKALRQDIAALAAAAGRRTEAA
ncbi:SRPBCC family protein [Micromonospora sp. WMMD1082]|uniref:SRPBCC family protein n=1 Tax=Micromonospora sp. WMMD1082 TaxID=3016104 RepID=UPI0024168E4F|nr:SRPBCC family protein [Micromonospora sp. WMMD1082]MDG4794308.1 SRPBCC family protein [Micromonospora sp. WMMD1082]